ncbi:aminoglycoside adenylyltransferase family protein [Nocardia fusca]|uniref:Aminoglycoside adenylyltransferase family protein n=1 Tax=Nocardia fusca TaxID=941183 RepID=A0ABV3F7C3_9NOCA
MPPAGLAADTAPITRIVTDLLGADLLGLYLYGSAVTSGLQYDSDLDFLAVTATALDGALRSRLAERLLRQSGRWPRTGEARPVELTVVARDAVVPWRFPPRGEFVYGEWMRAEFERGAVDPPAPDPDLAILLGMVRDSSVALAGPPAARLLDPVPPEDLVRAITESLPALLAGVDGDERNTILTLARMWITAETGAVVSKTEAAQRLAARVPPAHAALLGRARDGYLGAAVDDWAGHRAEVAAFVRYAAAGITAAADADREQH